MSDIFISYSSEDRDRILPLVNALGKTGWSVFWDRTIPAGKTWRQVISSEIQACRSVVVLWTNTSVTSEWVLEEAEIGKSRRILIPVLLDVVQPPFGFGGIQAANLTAWNEDSSSPPFARLVADIAGILGPAPAAMREANAQPKADHERLREQERQRSEQEAKRKADEENRSKDIASRLVNYVAEEFKKDQGVDLRNDSSALQRLKEAVEKAMRELSTIRETEINLPFITADATGPKHLEIKLTRTKLESLAAIKG